MMKTRLLLTGLMALALTACGGVEEVVEKECPEIVVLATADIWQEGDKAAQMKTAQLVCFIDAKTDELLADIVLTGTASQTGLELPFFVATLDKNDAVISRLQYKVKAGGTSFELKLPRYNYATRDTLVNKPRLVAGFVLSEAQLAANRAAYKKRIRLD